METEIANPEEQPPRLKSDAQDIESQPQQEIEDDTHCLVLLLECCFYALVSFFLPVLSVVVVCIIFVFIIVFVCIIFVVVLAIVPVSFAIVTVTLMLFLAVFLLVVRILQLLSSGDDYCRATHVYPLIRFSMYYYTGLFLIPLGIFAIIANTNPTIKHMTLSGQSITHWINATTLVCGFYLLSFCPFALVQSMSPPLSWQYENGINVTQSVCEIIDCLMFQWAASTVMKHVPPSFKQHQILGLHIKKWIEVLTFVLIGINIVAICCHGFNCLLQHLYAKLNPAVEKNRNRHFLVEKLLCRKYMVYWANGLTSSFIFIFGSMLLLLTCTSYFRFHLNATTQAKNVLRFGTLFCASLLILAFLWLIKSCILLTWKANQVYTRLRCRILENVEELYFLGLLGCVKYNFFDLEVYSSEPVEEKSPTPNEQVEEKGPPNEKKISELLRPFEHMSAIHGTMKKMMFFTMREKVKRDMLMHKRHKHSITADATLHDLHQMAQYFLAAQPTLSIDTYASDILQSIKDSAHERFQERNKLLPTTTGNTKKKRPSISKAWTMPTTLTQASNTSPPLDVDMVRQICFVQTVKHLIVGKTTHPENQDWGIFKSLLKSVSGNHEISEATLRNWLEKEHRTCLSLANTLSSAKEVVDCLNNIIGGILIAATFIVWLLLTGLATTKLLVLIASPLLAASFIFGDTCKSLFQGIIFAYVLHPFNVGDLCIIDDKMMEVKRLGVSKTIFVAIGNHEEVIYPNSVLANKKIINHKSEFDMNDCLEFNLRCFQSKEIKTLETNIKDYLKKEAKCVPNHFSIEVMTAEEDVKMIVHLKYKIQNQHGKTFYECLQEKHKLRFDFSINIWDLVNQYKSSDGSKSNAECSGEFTEIIEEQL